MAKINKAIKDSAVITGAQPTMLKNTAAARPTVFSNNMSASERIVRVSKEPRGW